MSRKTVTALAPLTALAALCLITAPADASTDTASAPRANSQSFTCSASPSPPKETLMGSVATIRLWNYATDYPVYAHVLPVTNTNGVKVEVQTQTLPTTTNPVGMMTQAYSTTLNKSAQVDVVAAPPNQPEVWLGSVQWNSDDDDINIMAKGSLSQGTAAFESCSGWR